MDLSRPFEVEEKVTDSYAALFEASPVPLWEEDFSLLKQYMDQLRQEENVTDFDAYFDAHPEEVNKCFQLVKIVDLNQAAVELYQAESKQDLIKEMSAFLGPEAFHWFKDELVLISQGATRFKCEGINYTLKGEEIYVEITLSVLPGHEETLKRVIVSTVDMTEVKRFERLTRLQTTALNTADNSFIITDSDGVIQWVNPGFTKLTGYSLDEVVGQNPRLLNADQTPPDVFADLWNTIKSGNTWRGDQLVNRRKDGTLYYQRLTITPITNEAGEIIQFVGVGEDITDRKQMEKRLRRQLKEEGFLQDITFLAASQQNLDEILTGICERMAWFYDVPKAAVAFFNEQKTEARVTVEFRDESQPSSIGAVIPVANNPSMEHLITHKTPLAIANVQTDPLMAPAHALMKRLGIVSMLLLPIMIGEDVVGTMGLDSTHPLEFTDDDQELGWRVTTQISQVLQRHQVEKKMEAERDFAYQVVNNMGQGLAVIDKEWRVTLCNPALADLLKYAPDVLVGISISKLTTASKAALLPTVNINPQASQSSTQELDLIRSDGSLIHTLVTAVPRLIEGEMIGAIVVVTDLSHQKTIEQKLAEARDQAVEASRLKSEFLANMSHEIRTPLNAIIGMTSLLIDTPLDNQQLDYVDTVRTSGDVLLSLINDILDFSKIEAGKLDLEKRPFDLRDCVEDALDVVVNKAAQKGLEIAYLIEDNVPSTLEGDVTRLRQVLVNLLNNAIKFTDKGEVILRLSQADVSPDGLHTLQFAVQDTGIGIPPERQNRLFKSFSQVDASTTRKYGGTGLGLAISKRLVELMGGNIRVESQVGEGSTFFFTIQGKSHIMRRRVFLRGKQPILSQKRILIVDDNQTNRLILTKQVEAWGMMPTTVDSATDALTLLEEREPFDLAVLDMHMPHMDGLMLAQAVQNIAHRRELPLIMLSSIGDSAELRQEDLFAAFLTKPVKPKQLYTTLNQLFGQKSPMMSVESEQPEIDMKLGEKYPLRILLAEDNVVNQKVALRILERMGYQADLAVNGLEVLEIMQDKLYDVILMDVQMPEMDGVEATQQIREIWPVDQQPAIVAMTANALIGDREKYLAVGMDEYISKPVRIKELMSTLIKMAAKHTA